MFRSFTSLKTRDDYINIFHLLSLGDSFINRDGASVNVTADIYLETLKLMRSYRRIVPRQNIGDHYVDHGYIDSNGNTIFVDNSGVLMMLAHDDDSNISQPRHRSYMENTYESGTYLADNEIVESQNPSDGISSDTIDISQHRNRKRRRSESSEDLSL